MSPSAWDEVPDTALTLQTSKLYVQLGLTAAWACPDPGLLCRRSYLVEGMG